MSWSPLSVLFTFLVGCGGGRAPTDLTAPGPDAAPSCDGGVVEGCPCDAPEPIQCYSGEPATLGVGPCRGGMRFCRDGVWSGCDMEVVARAETCDGTDEDCDGEVDELLRNACGLCEGTCEEIGFGTGPGRTPFEPGDCILHGTDLVVGIGRRAFWIPNTGDGTVSLVDVWDRMERGRYRTGPGGPGDAPSRTAIHGGNDLVIANRADGGQSSVTKILRVGCPDADGDGVLETSTGHDDVLPWGEDECVAWNVEVGGPGAAANAIVSDWTADRELVWVGLQNEERMVAIDGETGEATGDEVDTSPCRPFGATGRLFDIAWVSCNSNQIFRLDTWRPESSALVTRPDSGVPVTGIFADDRDRVWVGGEIGYYDTELEIWTRIPDTVGYGLGGWYDGIYVGACERPGEGIGTCAIDEDTLEVTFIDAASRAIDGDYAWGVPGSGVVTEIDPDSFEVTTVLDDCEEGPCLSGPDAYSQMAGHVWRWATQPTCVWRRVLEGCPDGQDTSWMRATAQIEPGGYARFSVRTAGSEAALETSEWTEYEGDDPSASLEKLLGERARLPWLEIQVYLGDSGSSWDPVRLRSVTVERNCG